MTSAYAELQVSSNYSFLRGASHPEELVRRAAELGYAAIAITDRNTLSGVVRAHGAAKETGIKLVVGTRLDLSGPDDGLSLLCYPRDRAAYGRLARLLTTGQRRAEKGECHLTLEDVTGHGEGQVIVVLPPAHPDPSFAETLSRLSRHFSNGLYLAAHVLYRGDDARRLSNLAGLAAQSQVPLVAVNDVHAHIAERRPLQDILTCIREHHTIHNAGYRLFANAERHLKAPEEMARLFRNTPGAIARTVDIARSCTFSLDELSYDYPIDPIPDDCTPQEELTRLTWMGAGEHYPPHQYPDGVPEKVRRQLEHELDLIAGLDFAPYFLTVHDIVRFARQRGILCQGRGSAANSAVCYCLGITAVDPDRIDLLFERFISAERNEPPDIDVDFEHQRREEVIQYIYEKYGRERAGMTATVTTYRTKSAIREVGKALGLTGDVIVALQGAAWRRGWDGVTAGHIREAGLDPGDRTIIQVIALAREVTGFPRHLSQHTGGMVITGRPLCEVVPIGNAAMAERTVIEWDKNDLDALGILKVDVLGLGMLTCIRKAFELIGRHHGRALTLATLPAEDPAVYDMLCRGDSVGVFQVESRAQMSMLPRLKPRNFYDLVIEVAIVRPGPIQGDMVHPYLRRRRGKEKVDFPSAELERVLGKTLGIPLFQEQAMQIAIVGAGFSPAEADGLRRAMATFRHHGEIHRFREKFITGMKANGYESDFAERCFRQIEGFADYGFPESHAASFALLVYVSSWIKCHYPAAFACALLNSQPLGFYAPAQIVGDARDHGVEVRPVDVNQSQWDCTLEATEDSVALRLGFRQVKGLKETDAEAMIQARGEGYPGIHDLWRRSSLSKAALETLARADAFRSMNLGRRQALWAVRGLVHDSLPLFAAAVPASREPAVTLPPMSLGEQVADDFRALRLSLKAHPLALLRRNLNDDGFVPTDRLAHLDNGQQVRVAGLVITRQQPGSAKGVIFITLEDEAGVANLIVWPKVFAAYRREVLGATLLGARGKVQRDGRVIHVIVHAVDDLSPMLARLEEAPELSGNDGGIRVKSRDFH